MNYSKWKIPNLSTRSFWKTSRSSRSVPNKWHFYHVTYWWRTGASIIEENCYPTEIVEVCYPTEFVEVCYPTEIVEDESSIGHRQLYTKRNWEKNVSTVWWIYFAWAIYFCSLLLLQFCVHRVFCGPCGSICHWTHLRTFATYSDVNWDFTLITEHNIEHYKEHYKELWNAL